MRPWMIACLIGIPVLALLGAFAWIVYAFSGVVRLIPLDYPENEDHEIVFD